MAASVHERERRPLFRPKFPYERTGFEAMENLVDRGNGTGATVVTTRRICNSCIEVQTVLQAMR